MPQRLRTFDADFENKFDLLLNAKRESSVEVSDAVADILHHVQQRGDDALIEFTAKFDDLQLTPEGLAFDQDEIDQAYLDTPDELIDALKHAYKRITAYHQRQLPKDELFEDEQGVTLGSKWNAVDAVGIYVPGGLASYPSSVLMNTAPARVAGVERVAMMVPTPGGKVNQTVLAAAKIAGVDEIYRVGGAQAIGALAFGTESIAPVNKIVGPGNAFVAAAKRQVYGKVGIDMIAGPSEVLVIADDSANPAWIAADLLAQAEHDTAAQSILVTTSPKLADDVMAEVERQLDLLPKKHLAGPSWADYGAVIEVNDLDEAFNISNRMAPEHLELSLDNAQQYIDKVRHAGAIFLGHHTPEAIGDYIGGTNHVLPTARSARYASGLNVHDFIKRISILGCTPSSLSALAPDAIALAEAEDLQAHGRSVSIRLNL
ncbi:histidinol dehydrogenase [Maritalea mobilis]|uniref:Histidinol dehydrogenase n=1 Tax=Maritalea mobilis TaxID=483324 RepID=A0A4R6VPE5_9HYPH|nr:histidinol dehydrogenase [Maritalea mobilis]TDQ64093.1 histidinol dehydrogenase [Maritalea mobilis]